MNREYRVIVGVAYPVLFNGKNQPTQVKANLADPAEYYYDDSIRLSEKDMAAYRNRPVCVEHDQSNVIGEIANVWKGKDGNMWMQARIFTDTPSGIDHFNRINGGDLSCLSVGYSVGTDNYGNVTGKDYHEISVCKEGFFPGAALTVAASGEKKYITNQSEYVKKLLFSIMASETNFSGGAAPAAAAPAAATPAAAATPLDARNKDASELARQSDSLLQQQAADAARLKALEQQVAMFKKKEEEQLAQYANKRKTDHEQAIGLLKEQWAEQHPGEAFPAEFEESAKSAFLHPDGERAAAVITANALSYKKQREELLAQKARFEEMEKKMKQFEADSEVAKAHVRASERLHMSTGGASPSAVSAEAPAASIAVNASKPNMSNLFLPSAMEKQLVKDNYGITIDESKINVNASATAVAPSSPFDLPTQQQVKFLPNSLFRHPQGKVLAEWTRNHFDKFTGARLAGAFVPETAVLEK